MSAYEYFQPATVAEAVELAAKLGPKAIFMAGGTDVIVGISEKIIRPEYLIYIADLEELKFIRLDDEGLKIGPLTTMTELAESEVAREKATALAEAASICAGPQVRNLGTLGGNLGTASPAGDLIPPLMALNALIKVVATDREKIIPAGEFFIGPKQNVLAQNELICEVIIPALPARSGSGFSKLGKRKAMTISIANAASVISVDTNGLFTDVRTAVGSLCPTVVRLKNFEAALIGKPATVAEIEKARDLVTEGVRPITDARATSWYRTEIAFPIVKKSMEHALEAIR